MDKIELFSRYGEKNYLEALDSTNKKYVLRTEIDSVSIGHTNGGDMFIDPSGGPMIIENHKLLEANRVVEKIQHVKNTGFVITFK